jgi:hypothetical protein
MWNEIEYDGDYFGDVPDGGTGAWSTMASGVDVRLGVDVAEVALSPDGVRWRRDGRAERGLARGRDRAARCTQAGQAEIFTRAAGGPLQRPSGGSGSAATRRWRCGSASHSGVPLASPTC